MGCPIPTIPQWYESDKYYVCEVTIHEELPGGGVGCGAFVTWYVEAIKGRVINSWIENKNDCTPGEKLLPSGTSEPQKLAAVKGPFDSYVLAFNYIMANY